MSEEKYLIFRKRKDMFCPTYWNLIGQTSPISKRIYGKNPSVLYLLFSSGKSIGVHLRKNLEETGKYIARRLFNDKAYFNNIQARTKRRERKIENFFKKAKNIDFSNLSFKELIRLAKEIKELWLGYDIASVLAWLYGGDQFKIMVGNALNLPEEDFLFLITPTKKTAVSQLEYDLLKHAKLIKQGKRNLETISGKLSEQYGWIPFGYDGPEYWEENYFIKKLKQKVKNYFNGIDRKIKKIEIKNKKDIQRRQNLLKKYKLNKKQKRLVGILNVLAVWTDERKKLDFKLHYYYSKVLLEIEKKYQIPYKNLKYLFTEELREAAKDRNMIIKKTNWRINNEFMIEFSNGNGGIISKQKKNLILKKIRSQQKGLSRIKGTVASKGLLKIYQGRAKIVLSSKEQNKVSKKDFLVAGMTSPDYVASMKKAMGFITDEGGITCHAAIVAREMNKPCIIGTKIATKVLKDGDLVKVDTEKGTVKILKKK